MSRGSAGGRAGSAGAGRAGRASSTARHAPQSVNHAPSAPAQSGRGSLRSTLAEGMAFGAGTAVAHRAVDAIMGPPTVRHETIVTQPAAAAAAAPAPTANSLDGDACNVHSKAFQDCLNSFGSDISKCQFYMDMLAECRKNFGGTLIA